MMMTNRSKVGHNPRDLRTHILRLSGPKTRLYKAFGLFCSPARQICLISAGPWARQIWAGTLVGKANLPYFGWVGTLVGKANLPCFGSAGPEP